MRSSRFPRLSKLSTITNFPLWFGVIWLASIQLRRWIIKRLALLFLFRFDPRYGIGVCRGRGSISSLFNGRKESSFPRLSTLSTCVSSSIDYFYTGLPHRRVRFFVAIPFERKFIPYRHFHRLKKKKRKRKRRSRKLKYMRQMISLFERGACRDLFRQ